MTIKDIQSYVDSLDQSLVKFSCDTENDGQGNMYVVKTKETYVLEDETDADKMVDDARQSPNFAGVKKDYKQGKINKAGEVVKPESWKVEIVYKF